MLAHWAGGALPRAPADPRGAHHEAPACPAAVVRGDAGQHCRHAAIRNLVEERRCARRECSRQGPESNPGTKHEPERARRPLTQPAIGRPESKDRGSGEARPDRIAGGGQRLAADVLEPSRACRHLLFEDHRSPTSRRQVGIGNRQLEPECEVNTDRTASVGECVRSNADAVVKRGICLLELRLMAAAGRHMLRTVPRNRLADVRGSPPTSRSHRPG